MESAQASYDEEGDDEVFELEMLDVTQAYFDLIDKTAVDSFGALETVGGNLLFHVVGVATRHIVTSGPEKGIYDEATDEPADYCFIVHQWALLHILEPDEDDPLTLEELVKRGALEIDGDPSIYKRFMALGDSKKGVLSIRCA